MCLPALSRHAFWQGSAANVLRIDPLDWMEANVEPEGYARESGWPGLKPPARRGSRHFRGICWTGHLLFFCLLDKPMCLVARVNRPDVLANLGYDEETLRRLAPDVIEVSLDA